ncbi:MAG: aminotransferase class III-fold pyridoxal phosphate-dependent enzyme, partial [Gammaproteobacteria bacterium]|nr:aminotransferase class III-fold pyridoxal phosphate-dependent enzyme [Gammaproteobacteria bacterium]
MKLCEWVITRYDDGATITTLRVARGGVMANVFYRNPGHDYPMAVRAEGVYLVDQEGRQYLDASGGAAISCLGHGHPEVISAVRDQVEKMAFAHSAFFTNEPQERLAELLSRQFGADGARVYFVSGGSEANETALKMARQYWVALGRRDKRLFISRHQSYHGNTLGALSVSGNMARQPTYGAILQDWPKIDPCYAYRHRRVDETDEEYGRRAAAA